MPTTKDRINRFSHTLTEFIFGGRRFCCCIPTRFGVIAGSLLTFLITGALAIVIWFEVSTEHDMTFSPAARTEFILGGLLETLLFVASILGFIGGIVRKQLFITIYGYFLYVHFLINFGVGIFLLWRINHTTDVDVSVACHKTITNPDAQKQCASLLNDFRGFLNGIIVIVLLIELYGALIVTRYMRQLKLEKRRAKYSSDGLLLKPQYYASVEGEDYDLPEYRSSYYPHGPFSASEAGLSATHFPMTPETLNTSDLKQHYYDDK